MKVCVVTTTHPAEDNRIYLREIESLLLRYEIIYVTTNNLKDKKDNLTVISQGEYQKGLFKRLKRSYQAYQQAKKSGADVIHFHEFDFLFWGFWLQAVNKKKVIYDVHEDYPALARSREYIPVFLKGFLAFVIKVSEALFTRRFSGIIVVTEELKNRMQKYNRNTTVIANYPATRFFKSYEEKNYQDIKKIKIAHLGNLYLARGAEVIAEGIGELNNTTLTVIGEIAPNALKEEILSSYPGKITVTGHKNYQEALQIASQCDLGIIGYLPLDNQNYSSPNKLFEYMGLALPIFASDLPVFKDIITKTGAGITYESQNPKDLKAKLKSLTADSSKMTDYSKKSKEAFNEYNWSNEERKLMSFYENITKN